MERSHIPLHKWVQGMYLLCSSKKGISAHQLHRTLSITYKAAWFMAHRIREAMRDGSLGPLGGNTAVEADETFIGRKEGVPVPKGGYSHKHAVLALVERGGKVRSVHLNGLTKAEVGKVVRENVAREAWLFTTSPGSTAGWALSSLATAASTTRWASTSILRMPRSTRTRSKGCSRSSSAA
jgi:hypothetical protein